MYEFQPGLIISARAILISRGYFDKPREIFSSSQAEHLSLDTYEFETIDLWRLWGRSSLGLQ